MPDVGEAKYPYPNASAVPDVPLDFLAIANRLALMNDAGIGRASDATSRAALVTNNDATPGFVVYQVDDDAYYQYDGTDWWAYDFTWKTFTPTFAAGVTLGNGTVSGWRLRQGQVWKERIRLQLGSTSSITGLITVNVTTLENSIALEQVGAAFFRDDSAATNYPNGVVMKVSASTVGIYEANVASTYPVLASTSSTTPFTWATSDFVAAKYELWLA